MLHDEIQGDIYKDNDSNILTSTQLCETLVFVMEFEKQLMWPT
jgi:hypothetical protein